MTLPKIHAIVAKDGRPHAVVLVGMSMYTYKPLVAQDARVPARRPRVGERWRFAVADRSEEIVEILRGPDGLDGFVSAAQGVVFLDANGWPGVGRLESIAAEVAPHIPTPHEAITLEDWRRKARSPAWPRGG